MKFVRFSYLLWFLVNKSQSAVYENEFRTKKQQKQRVRGIKEDALESNNTTSGTVRLLEEIEYSVLQIVAGGTHTCVLLDGPSSSKSVRCFGDNSDGQLGYGDLVDRTLPPPGPIAFPDGYTPTKITGGGSHSCAILLQNINDPASSSVWCWGFNSNKYLVDQADVADDKVTSPVQVVFSIDPSSYVVDIVSGNQKNCVIFFDKTFYCWGNNVQNRPGIQVDMIAVTGNTCVIFSADKSIECWGLNPQYYDNDVLKNLQAKYIAVGSLFACAVLLDDTPVCWGYNINGQLGNDSTQNSNIPVSPLTKTGATVSTVILGSFHSCATFTGENDRPQCWGTNSHGQLGLGSTENPKLVPQDILVTGDIDMIIAGGSHSCARYSDGRANCWGRNGDGQLGIGNTNFAYYYDVQGSHDITSMPFIDFGTYTAETTEETNPTVPPQETTPSLSSNTWYIGRIENSEKVTFSEGESAELEIDYNISADKTDVTYLKITPMDDTCENEVSTFITYLPYVDGSSTTVSEIVTTSDGISLYKAKFDIDETSIMTSNLYSAETNAIKTCINAELMSGDESVSFVKTKLTIPVVLTADFNIASFGAATVEDENVTEDAVVDYAINAFKCRVDDATEDDTALPKNTPVRICLVPTSTEVEITQILSLTLTQQGSNISRQRITDANTRDALTEDDVALPDTSGISVITRVGTEFYDTPSAGVTVGGTVELAFKSTGGGRHLAKFNFVNMDRDLQDEDGPQSSFGFEIGLEDDAEEESASHTLASSVALVTITSLLAAMMM